MTCISWRLPRARPGISGSRLALVSRQRFARQRPEHTVCRPWSRVAPGTPGSASLSEVRGRRQGGPTGRPSGDRASWAQAEWAGRGDCHAPGGHGRAGTPRSRASSVAGQSSPVLHRDERGLADRQEIGREATGAESVVRIVPAEHHDGAVDRDGSALSARSPCTTRTKGRYRKPPSAWQ